MELAVIGHEDFVLGFKLAGIRKTIAVQDKDKLENAVKSYMQDSDIGILIMHQNDIINLPAELQDTLSESVEPTIVALGGEGGSSMRDKIKQAVGVDLWK